MNTINCDNCKAEIQMKKDLIETKHLSGGIQINFFRCKKCNSKYLIDITDRTTREKQQELRKWSEARKKALDINIEGMSEGELNRLAVLTDETKYNIDRLTDEIKEAKAELKKKYAGDIVTGKQ